METQRQHFSLKRPKLSLICEFKLSKLQIYLQLNFKNVFRDFVPSPGGSVSFRTLMGIKSWKTCPALDSNNVQIKRKVGLKHEGASAQKIQNTDIKILTIDRTYRRHIKSVSVSFFHRKTRRSDHIWSGRKEASLWSLGRLESS